MELKEGDELIATSTRDGLMLNKYSAEVAEEVALGRAMMKRYRSTFRELAK